MRLIRVQTVDNGVTLFPYERCLLGTPAKGIRNMEPSHLPPVALRADMATPDIPADITATDLFAGNQHHSHLYDDYMGYGMRMTRARIATMDNEFVRRGRWQHVMRISANVSGMPQGLP
ncbi:MAG: hypothetical protein MMC33_003633 [Icmadophila ericetorum]|nr:hypothetical protein [Icmadophila ericetorum]